jgi:hypothetical protein
MVLFGVQSAPQPSDEEAERMGEDPSIAKGAITTATRALYRFMDYDEISVNMRPLTDEADQPRLFVPWGVVLRMELIRSLEGAATDEG